MTIFTALAILALVVVFMPGRSGAVVNGSPTNFESSDGNMTVEGSPGADWNCFANGVATGFQASGVTVGTGTCSGSLKAANAAAIHPGTAETTANETAWKSGQKMDTACPVLENKSSTSVPNKDDFTDVAQYFEIDSHLNEYLYGAEERLTANGNSSGNVELNQVGGIAGCPINRTAGDRLLAFNFVGGGTTLNFGALTWITPTSPNLGGNTGTCNINNSSPPCWGANEITGATPGITVGGCGTSQTAPFTNDVEGCSNQSEILPGNNGISGTDLVANQFAEFGVNLTKVLNLPPCNPFAQETYESRTSGSSFTSNPEDIEILSKQIATCGSITVIKHTDPRGASQVFSYSTTGGLSPSTFSLNDNGCSVASCTGNTRTYLDVPEGPYTVAEGSEPSGFVSESVSCTNNGSSTNTDTSISGVTVTINLQPNDNIVCTYVNQALGTINIIKHTDPGGVNQDFSFTSNVTSGTASTGTLGSFTLNDSATNEQTMTNVPVGSYQVTEGTEPSAWTFESLSCTPSSGTSNGVQHAPNSLQADITLGAGGTVTCTYVNRQPGAIQITKVSSKSNSDFLPGAQFELCTNAGPYSAGSPCVAPTGVTNPLPLTDSNGVVCVSGLPRLTNAGTTYYVQELSAPAGYTKDANNHSVLVNMGATCSSGSPATIMVQDVPLTDLTITATSEATGGTNSQITCKDSSSNNVGNSPSSNQPSANVTANGLKPGTYTCTVVVDP